MPDEPLFVSDPDRDVTMALYTALYVDEGMATVAARRVAVRWSRPIAVIGAGVHSIGASPFSGERVWAMFDLTEDDTGEVRRRAIVVVESGNG